MKQLARRLTDFFIRKGIVSAQEREVYEYGFDITLYTIVSTLGLLVTGAALGRLQSTVIIVALFYTCQSFGGGYHASTHLRCFLSMCAGLLAGLALEALPVPQAAFLAAGAASAALLLAVPLVLHPNKSYLRPQAPALARKSRLATLACVAVSAALIALLRLPAQSFAVAFLLAAVSRTVARMQRTREERRAQA